MGLIFIGLGVLGLGLYGFVATSQPSPVRASLFVGLG